MSAAARRFTVRATLALLLLAPAAASTHAAPGFSAVTVDARTGKVLFSVEPDSQRHPASLTKVMTLYILFQELKAGRLKLTSQFTASAYSASRPPSRLGLKPGGRIIVEDAIKALVTRSANDVAATIGENISGSEKAFAARMTRTARSMGMTRTTFRNASGLPDTQQVTTARDMATLSLRIQRDFPEYYPYFRISGFTYKGTVIRTHNRLLGRFAGTDGIKTGYIRASGYNLTSSVARNGKRLVGVVLGAKSGASRNKYMMAMLDKQFRQASTNKANVIAAMCGTPPGYKGDPTPVVADARDAPMPLPAPKPRVVAAEMSAPFAASAAVRETGAADAQALLKEQETITSADQSQLATLLPEPDVAGDDEEAAEDRAADDDEDLSAADAGFDWPSPTSVAKDDSHPQATKTVTASAAADPFSSQLAPKDARPPSDPLSRVASNSAAVSARPKQSWQIQIGAYPDKSGAMRQVQAALVMDVTSLKGKTGFAMPITRGASTLYRARFSGFTASSARQACSELAEKGMSCLALAPQG